MASSTRTKSRARRTTTKPKAKAKAATPEVIIDPAADSSDLLRSVSLTFTQQDIELRAYQIWRRKGCPIGQDDDNWRQAEQELTAEALNNR